MKVLNCVALTIAIIGAINWGLIGFFDFNLVSGIFGASTATISRVNRSLNYGNASYDKVFARLEEKNKA